MFVYGLNFYSDSVSLVFIFLIWGHFGVFVYSLTVVVHFIKMNTQNLEYWFHGEFFNTASVYSKIYKKCENDHGRVILNFEKWIDMC